MTVGELMAELRKYPEDSPAVIWDADTEWLLDVTFVAAEVRKAVSIGGSYSNIFGDKYKVIKEG